MQFGWRPDKQSGSTCVRIDHLQTERAKSANERCMIHTCKEMKEMRPYEEKTLYLGSRLLKMSDVTSTNSLELVLLGIGLRISMIVSMQYSKNSLGAVGQSFLLARFLGCQSRRAPFGGPLGKSFSS